MQQSMLDIINLHIHICTCWLFLTRNHQCMVTNHFKMGIITSTGSMPYHQFAASSFGCSAWDPNYRAWKLTNLATSDPSSHITFI